MELTKVSVIRCVLGSVLAIAAALGLPAAALADGPQGFKFKGFYGGIHGGYGWGDTAADMTGNDLAAINFTCGGAFGGTCIPPASFGRDGAVLGVQAGYNLMLGAWLLGGEVDFAKSTIAGSGSGDFVFGNGSGGTDAYVQHNEDLKFLATLRARIGYAVSNALLVYGTGGLAVGRSEHSVSIGTQGYTNSNWGHYLTCASDHCFDGRSSKTVSGWTAGFGFEYAISKNLSLKAEYLYVAIGGDRSTQVINTEAVALPAASYTAGFKSDDLQTVRIGLNLLVGQ